MTTLLGRFLQLVGLVMLPIALMIGLIQDNVALETRMLFIGGIVFFIGWVLARKRE